MLVRLYYKIHDAEMLIKELTKIECIEAKDNNTYSLNYEYEAKEIEFSSKYKNTVLHEKGAIVLANCKIINESTFVVDVKSHHRCLRMIEFIEKYISREIIQLTDAATYNKIVYSSKC